MAYLPPEVIEQARQIDLLTYMQTFEPTELVRISPNCYTTRTHDSLKISNGKWMWWSQRIGGYNALDYLVKVKGVSFLEAVETLIDNASALPMSDMSKPKSAAPKVLVLPEKSKSNDRIIKYLFSRGIDYAIIEYCISKGMIYESLPYHNIVFVGYDAMEKPKYAAFRATNSSRIMGDCAGSDKHFSFRIAENESEDLHLFECAIDLLSFATLERIEGREWNDAALISLAGVYSPKEKVEESTMPAALSQFLSEHEKIKRIFLHLDNDAAGRSAARALQVIIPSHIEVINSPPPQGKDYNDYLCMRLGIRSKIKERSVER